MIVTLPWPNRVLSPNAREHWRNVARVKKAARLDAYWLTVAAYDGETFQAPTVAMEFCPPDNRRRDLDNMIAAMKAGLDGISQAIGVDDRHFALSAEVGEIVPRGAVFVTVEAAK